MKNTPHLKSLTSLRFFAAFWVLLFHSGASMLASLGGPSVIVRILKNGYLGVSFFFVLSGFILAYAYQDSSMKNGERGAYFLSRFARVYPVFVLSLLLMIPFVEVGIFGEWCWQFLMLQTWVPASLAEHTSNWNMQAWTLSVEAFFYLVFPLLFPIIRRASDRHITVGCAAVCLTMFAIHLNLPGPDDAWDSNWLRFVPIPVLRTPEFLYGVLMGTLFCRDRLTASPRILSTIVALMTLSAAISTDSWVAAVSAVSFGGIIALTPLTITSGVLHRILTSQNLVLLGKASYCIYILQLPVRLIVREFGEPLSPALARIAYMPILLGVSILVLIYFEEPVREFIRRASTTRSKHSKSG